MKTTVYYHIWSPADTDLWKIMVDDQIKRLYRSGLPEVATVKCAINGPQASRISRGFCFSCSKPHIMQYSNMKPDFSQGILDKTFQPFLIILVCCASVHENLQETSYRDVSCSPEFSFWADMSFQPTLS